MRTLNVGYVSFDYIVMRKFRLWQTCVSYIYHHLAMSKVRLLSIQRLPLPPLSQKAIQLIKTSPAEVCRLKKLRAKIQPKPSADPRSCGGVLYEEKTPYFVSSGAKFHNRNKDKVNINVIEHQQTWKYLPITISVGQKVLQWQLQTSYVKRVTLLLRIVFNANLLIG